MQTVLWYYILYYLYHAYRTCIHTIRMFYYYGWLTSSRQRNIARISGVRRCSLQVYIIIIKMYVHVIRYLLPIYTYTCIIYVDVYIIYFPYLLYIFFQNIVIDVRRARICIIIVMMNILIICIRAPAMKSWTTLYIIIKIYENVRSSEIPVCSSRLKYVCHNVPLTYYYTSLFIIRVTGSTLFKLSIVLVL